MSYSILFDTDERRTTAENVNKVRFMENCSSSTVNSAASMPVDFVKDGALIPCHSLVWLVPPLDVSNTKHKIYTGTFKSIFYQYICFAKPAMHPAVSVLGLLSLALCQSPVGLLSIALNQA